jgi:DNA-binding SARP family transcriptional activator
VTHAPDTGPARPGLIRLLGRPAVEPAARPRGRKAWGLLAYLLLADVPPTRRRLVSLLFTEAEDPLRALRWNLAELRRSLGPSITVGGDPVVLRLHAGTQADVQLLGRGLPVALVGGELLEGLDFPDSPAFEAWLAVERRRLEAVSEAVLHDAAVTRLAGGLPDEAAALAARCVALDPLNADHHAVLVRSLATAGATAAARGQVVRCTALFRRELGVDPPPTVAAAAA